MKATHTEACIKLCPGATTQATDCKTLCEVDCRKNATPKYTLHKANDGPGRGKKEGKAEGGGLKGKGTADERRRTQQSESSPALAKPVAHTPAAAPFSALNLLNLRITASLCVSASPRCILICRPGKSSPRRRPRETRGRAKDRRARCAGPARRPARRAREKRPPAAPRPATCCPGSGSGGARCRGATGRSAGRCCGG